MEQFAELPMQPSLAQCPYSITETQVKVHSKKSDGIVVVPAGAPSPGSLAMKRRISVE
jgi:hypothetical protein